MIGPIQQRDQMVSTLVADYQKKFHADAVSEQLVAIYDKHFTDDEIKGLLQFYNSSVGRKFAAEMPKIAAEAQAANHEEGTRTATEVVQKLAQQTSASPVEDLQSTGRFSRSRSPNLREGRTRSAFRPK